MRRDEEAEKALSLHLGCGRFAHFAFPSADHPKALWPREAADGRNAVQDVWG
jgi:hypothetical protein